MTRVLKLLSGAAVLACVAVSPAFAQTVTGSLTFGGSGPNYFDRANSNVPAGYGNSTGAPTVAIGSGVEFGFDDTSNLDTANFTPTSLTISDLSRRAGSITFTMTFSTTTVGLFDNAAFSSNDFGGTLSVTNNVLTFTAPTFTTPGTRTAVITFAGAPGAVPEPATWAMMLFGFGAVGAGVRRQLRRSEAKFNARIKLIEEGVIA